MDDVSLLDQLTPRQRQVLKLLSEYKTSKEIALELGISPYTVDNHIAVAAFRFGVGNRRKLAGLYRSIAASSEEFGGQFSGMDQSQIENEPMGQGSGVSPPPDHAAWESYLLAGPEVPMSANTRNKPNDDVSLMLQTMGEELLAIAARANGPAQPLARSRHNNREKDDPELGTLADQLYRERRRRAHYFPRQALRDAGWDILLDLFASSKRNRLVAVTDACLATDVPPTTALRYVGLLEDLGLIVREEDISDARRTWLTLTRKGLDMMTSYLRDIGQPKRT